MNKSRMKMVCFVITIVLIICCFVGCGDNKTSKTTIVTDTTVTTTNIPTTQSATITSTTEVPTTVKPTEVATEATNDVKEDYDNNNVENYESPTEDVQVETNAQDEDVKSEAFYSPNEFMNAGVIDWGGWTWTYYSERILPGEGLWIPGRWTDSDGYVCDENGYVCLASTSVDRYSIIETPFGRTGKVYDTGCDYGVMDVYVNW